MVTDSLLHFVVIHEISASHVVVADPAVGIRKLPTPEFLRSWTGALLLLVPRTDFRPQELGEGVWRRFLRLLQPHDFLLAECLLATVFIMVLGLGFSIYVQLLVDKVIPRKDWTALRWMTLSLAGLVVARAALGQLRGVLLAHVSRKIDASIMVAYYSHVLRQPMQFFEAWQSGEIISRLGDVVKIREALSGTTLMLIIDTATVLSLYGLLGFYSLRLAAVAMGATALVGLVTYLATGPLRKYQRKAMECAASLRSHFVETLGAMGIVKANLGEENAIFRGEALIVRMLGALFRTTLWAASALALNEAILGGVIVIVLWGAGSLVLRGELTSGQLVGMYSILLFMSQPLTRFMTMNLAVQDAFVAADRLCDVLDLEPEPSASPSLVSLPPNTPGSISVKDIVFSYPGRLPVLRGLTVDVPAGSTLGIIGTSGSGKSTLAKLLLRYYEPSSGTVCIDGFNLRDLALASIRTVVGFVDQDATLYGDTILDALTMGDESIAPAHVITTVKAIGLGEFVDSLPLRYDTPIGSRGLALSGGQRQRLAIARALLRSPRVLVLDEVTTSLDPNAERQVMQALAPLKPTRTIIVIGQRPSAVSIADQVMILDHGQSAGIVSYPQFLMEQQQDSGYPGAAASDQAVGRQLRGEGGDTK
jgi:ATP-binding cassette subfamily B protein